MMVVDDQRQRADRAPADAHHRGPRISLISAMARDRVIGLRNALPWHLPADMQHFRALTMGHAVFMGRKTFESLAKPLPGRTNIVLTSDHRYAPAGCLVVHSIEDGLRAAGEDTEMFVIGGQQLYAQMLPRADRLYLTLIAAEFAGDAWFPEIDWRDWEELERTDHTADDRNAYAYSFVTLDRRRNPAECSD